MDNLPPKEISDEEMINQAFHELLNDYLNTKHRKKVEIITKAFLHFPHGKFSLPLQAQNHPPARLGTVLLSPHEYSSQD